MAGEPTVSVGSNATNEVVENYYDFYGSEAQTFSSFPILVIEYILTAVAGLGVIVNITCFTLITVMRRKGKIKSTAEAFLIQQQAAADFFVCSLTIPIMFFNIKDMSTVSPWKEFVCLFWYSQFFYWWAMLLSAFNLMLISVDWLLEVCFIEKHIELRKILGWMLFTIHVCALGGAIPCIFSQKIVASGACLQPTNYDTDALNGMFISWMGAWVFFAYIIPIVVAAFCYGYMIYFYKKRLKTQCLGPERETTKRNIMHLVKCLLSVVVFILFVGFDSVDWLFDAIEVADYVFNSPRQRFTVMILVVNSLSNPLIHVILSPEVQAYVSTLRICYSPDDATPMGVSYISSQI